MEDPVLIVAISLFGFLVAPLLLRRLKIPGIIGILVVGTVIGPNGIGLLQRDETIVLLGTVGINYLMFTAGLEIDVNDFLESPERSLVYALLSFALPFSLGTAVGVAGLGFSFPTATLFAAAFASHTLLALPVVDNVRDLEFDREKDDPTLAVVIGERWSRIEYTVLLAVAYVAPPALWV
ncbi:MAG: cation:proton antiporter [Haloquadratum sp.]